jgi:hypothetical protein
LHLQAVLHFATYFDLIFDLRLITIIEKWIEVVELVELEGSTHDSVVVEMILLMGIMKGNHAVAYIITFSVNFCFPIFSFNIRERK